MRIDIKGVIVDEDDKWIYDYFEIPAVSPNCINSQIRNAKENEELEIYINSGGGSVFAGSEIYTNLKDYPGNVTVKIVGIAGSSASVIAMAGNKILMSPTAQIMIHNASLGVRGNHSDLEQAKLLLRSVDTGIANAYQLKTKMEHKDLLELMEKETWMNAQLALANKFADEIMFDDNKIIASTNLNSDGTLPSEVINKMKNESRKSKELKINNTHEINITATITGENTEVIKNNLEKEILKAQIELMIV